MNSISFRTRSLGLSALRAKDSPHRRRWVLVNAEGQRLGRLASQIAHVLRGKHKTAYSPHMDMGDDVVVIHADKVSLSGKKWDKKEYIWHTGYSGGQRRVTARALHAKHPLRLLERAVKGMLPKNALGRQCFRHLHVYAGAEHPHEAQNPIELAHFKKK